MKRAALAALLAIGLPLAYAGDAAPVDGPLRAADRPTLLVLPVQDRVGDPQTALLVEGAIRATLRHLFTLPDNARVRGLMREERLRDPRNIRPSLVAGVAESVGAHEVLVVTLLASGGRDVPFVTLSAQTLVPGEIELSWAGFVARDGLDREGALGVGRVDSLEELASAAGRELALAFLERRGPSAGRRLPLQTVFRRQALALDALSPAVVLPFGASLGRQAAQATQIATDLTFATLHSLGVRILWPGALHELLIHKPHPSVGEVRPSDRALIRSALRARTLVTGHVEYRNLGGRSERPLPEVGFGARAVDASTGEIVWTAGVAAGGWDDPGPFGVSRTYGLDTLSKDALVTLYASIEGPATIEAAAPVEQ